MSVRLIKTLWADFKFQVTHHFVNVILPLKYLNGQIVKGVIAFLIVYIQERCNLRKGVSKML